MPHHEHPAHGFTLTELLITLAIIGILAMIGAPAMATLLANTRSASAEASIATSLRHARTAAIMHNRRVVACPSADGHACDDTRDWQHGWIIADDADHDGQPDAGTPVIATFPATSPGARITTSAGRKLVAFHPNGSAAGRNASFTICNTRSGSGEEVVVSNAGRVRTATASPRRLQACLAGLQ
ncbi:MAG TPA: GspH/FimT family pseudopilin [Rhodanobacteraceae bacterium]|nr:GspH/FimT family pseudopilin [Rhodanobacteraceae bacterium]